MKIKINNLLSIIFIIFLVLICTLTVKIQGSTDTIKVYKSFNLTSKKMEFNLKSSAFNAGDTIPTKYICKRISGGKNMSIPIEWSGAPSKTKSYAISMYDLNPVAKNFIHWAVINIPSSITKLEEGASSTSNMPNGSMELKNSSGSTGYVGPCPPQGTGKHEYKIIVYALDIEKLNLSGFLSLNEFQTAIKDNILGQSQFSAYFEQ